MSLDSFARPGTPTWEHGRFVDEVLTPLRAGRTARYRSWPFDAATPRGWAEVPAGGLVVVEGVSALAHAVTDRVGRWWDLSLWIDVPEDIRRARIEQRDPPSVLRMWRELWWPSEQRYLDDEQPHLRADFVVCGTITRCRR